MYFALDLGGTNLRISWTETLTDVNLNNIVVTPNNDSYKDDLEQVKKIIHDNSREKPLKGIAIGLAGSIYEDQTKVRVSNNLSTWANKDFVSNLSSLFNCPVFLMNDATIASLGEAIYGDIPKQSFIYITWGTGIGGCIVNYSDGVPKPRDLGWFEYFENWELSCSGGHAKVNFGKELKDLDDGQWNKVVSDFVKESVSIVEKLKLDSIVLGGGILDKQERRVQDIKQRLEDNDVQMFISKLKGHAGIYGGFALLKITSNI